MKYRVKKIWYGENARYDLDELLKYGSKVSDLASTVMKDIININQVSMNGPMREALGLMVRYEIVAHCWGNLWTAREAADVFVNTSVSGKWSSSASVAGSIMGKLAMVGLLNYSRNEYRNETRYSINYPKIAELTGIEIIPEAYER